MMTVAQMFSADRQGRRFTDVVEDQRISFAAILEFFDDPQRQRRMIESEQHHDRPPLAGVIRELESRPDVHEFFVKNDGHSTTRFRQAIGVVVRIIMENHRWQTTGRKGSLGVRAEGVQRTKPGAYHNTGGLALWFLRAERYRDSGSPFRSVSDRAREVDIVVGRTSETPLRNQT